MIPRRIAEHVKAHNWFAVGIDFLIVVVGVFIGIQVSNWNAARAETTQAYDLLAAVATDLHADLDQLRAGEKSLRASIGAGNYALAAIGAAPVRRFTPPAMDAGYRDLPGGFVEAPDVGEPSEADKARLWLLIVAGYYPTSASTSYDSLTNVGKLGIIDDPALVRDLQAYFQMRDGLDETHAGTLRPLRNEAVIIGQRYGVSPFMDFPAEDFIAAIREHEELRAVVQTQIGYKALHLSLITSADAAASALLARLENLKTQQ